MRHRYLGDDNLWQQLVPGGGHRGPLGMLPALTCTYKPTDLQHVT